MPTNTKTSNTLLLRIIERLDETRTQSGPKLSASKLGPGPLLGLRNYSKVVEEDGDHSLKVMEITFYVDSSIRRMGQPIEI